MRPDEIDQLSPRDRHLFLPGPKRILSLDGGGVRGAISIAFLERLERTALRKSKASRHYSAIGLI